MIQPNAAEPPARPFSPSRWIRGGHMQTLVGHWRRKRLHFEAPNVDHVVASGEARLLVRASWQPGTTDSSPCLVLLHGLGGSDRSGYITATGQLAFASGWHVLRMNMRGAGDGEAICPLIYNAGLDGDLVAVLRWAATHSRRLGVVAFSLGGNMAVLAAGRSRDELPGALRAIVAVSAPLDLAMCIDALERPSNRIYELYFLKSLSQAYRRRATLDPVRFPPGRERHVARLRAFDDAITAPHGGFGTSAEYYARSSAGPWLEQVSIPTLLLNAVDDPFVPIDSAARWPRGRNGVHLETTRTGGHMGFVGETQAPGRFWAAERVLDFLATHV